MPDPINIFTRKKFAGAVVDPAGDPSIIEILEKCLNDAKLGHLKSLVLGATTNRDTIVTAWSASMFHEPYLFLGILDSIKARLQNFLIREEDYEE